MSHTRADDAQARLCHPHLDRCLRRREPRGPGLCKGVGHGPRSQLRMRRRSPSPTHHWGLRGGVGGAARAPASGQYQAHGHSQAASKPHSEPTTEAPPAPLTSNGHSVRGPHGPREPALGPGGGGVRGRRRTWATATCVCCVCCCRSCCRSCIWCWEDSGVPGPAPAACEGGGGSIPGEPGSTGSAAWGGTWGDREDRRDLGFALCGMGHSIPPLTEDPGRSVLEGSVGPGSRRCAAQARPAGRTHAWTLGPAPRGTQATQSASGPAFQLLRRAVLRPQPCAPPPCGVRPATPQGQSVP